MLLFPISEDFTTFVKSLIREFGVDKISHDTGIPISDLNKWNSGQDHYYPYAEWLLYGFCVNQQALTLLNPYFPAYDKLRELDLASPPLGYELIPPRLKLRNQPRKIAGKMVNFPLGISASVLTRNSQSIAFYANRGFDILTYKTVRSVKRDAHPIPNWVFVHPEKEHTVQPPFSEPMFGDIDYWPKDPYDISMANSFGIPSQEPNLWQADVKLSKDALANNQILIVSVVASPGVGSIGFDEDSIISDFVRVAEMAKESGADVIEANFSCPNTPNDPTGIIYKDAELSGRVSAALSRTLGSIPLFVKIGYLEKTDLANFVRHNRDYVQGIVAINTISMPVLSEQSMTQLFPGAGRNYAGVSGSLIRPWAMKVVQDLVEIRHAEKAEDEFVIIGVGGVSTPRDIYDYLNLGADAVESCTAAYLNPYLAIQTRLQPLDHEREEVEKDIVKLKKPSTKKDQEAQLGNLSLDSLSKLIFENRDLEIQIGATQEFIKRIKESKEPA